jgi:ABC-type polysaccharide/polyol phosphate transport system ATPase subunit
MTSTSASKSRALSGGRTNPNVVLEIESLKPLFPMRLHRSTSLRDVFVRTINHPLKTLLTPPQKLEVLDGVNLTVERGDRIALMGVNGVGKTTLCRAIAGFYRPTAGQLRLYGQTRAIFDTMVGIYPELTGRENAGILVDFLYPTIEGREEKLREALEFSELNEFLETPFKYYSNGMQARLCLSVLTIEPTDLLILDEVFEGADRFFREKIAARVLRMIENSGSVIFVSHSEEQLKRVCNRAVVLRDGVVAFDGDLEEGLAFYTAHQPTPF